MREPDIVLFHRQYGLWVFECKGCSIDNVTAIQGHVWKMANWYAEEITPLMQAEDQMFAIQNKLNTQRELRDKIRGHFRVALPEVKRSQWEEKGFEQHTQAAVWTYENLTPKALRKSIEDAIEGEPQPLDEETWELARKVLGGTLPRITPRDIPTGTPPISPLRVIKEIESNLKALDETQQQIAFQVPDGSQRLRGLAGTGKTVLLAERAAKMHIKHPDWTIGFVFFTQSLYKQIQKLITRFCNNFVGYGPDWDKLKVLHSWGGRTQNGFYYNLALWSQVAPLTLGDVMHLKLSPGQSFEYICLDLIQKRLQQGNYSAELSTAQQIMQLDPKDFLSQSDLIQAALIEAEEKNLDLLPQLYDALIVDEGQDLPPVFYKLLRATLKKPKRIYWAYDEAQGIGSLMIPQAQEMFGQNAQGKPRVDVSGIYPGGIQKSHRMNKCYRTPRLLLMTAHGINMGLLRPGGPLQGVSRQDQWEALGYEILSGDFSAGSVNRGDSVTITRPPEKSPHPIDQDSFTQKESLGDVLTYRTFNTEDEEQQWVAEQVKQDLDLGFQPKDILITALYGYKDKEYLLSLKEKLESIGIAAYAAGVEILPGERWPNRKVFRLPGKVTLSNIFRAKGNEARKVYACRFHYATQPLKWKQETEIHKRNEAFVALTRAQVWCVVTGLNQSNIFDELQQAIDQAPNLTFKSFNKRTLKRVTDDAETDDAEDEQQTFNQ